MLATALTLALLGVALAAIAQHISRDGDKIMAALRGDSWAATPPNPRLPVMVRVSQRYPAIRPMRAAPRLTQLEWRAAA